MGKDGDVGRDGREDRCDDGSSRRYVALLRGINVSGHNPVAMKDLRALFESLPAEDVATYLQSGNVVFRSKVDDADRLGELIETRIQSQAGFKVLVLVRPAEEFDRVMAANPFLADGRDPAALYVTFLAVAPDPDRVTATTEAAGPAAPDELRPGEREIYLYCPNGYGRTKLNNAFFERKLVVAATTRNWRTVTAVAEMAHR